MDADFVAELGLPFLAHRLRRVSELFVADYGRWLKEAGIEAPPRSISTLLLLRQESPLSVTTIADRLRFTHPLIIALTSKLEAQGLTAVTRDPADARRRLITLTPKGRREADKVEAAAAVIGRAYQALSTQTGVDLLDAVTRVEAACAGTSFHQRLRSAAAELAEGPPDPPQIVRG